MNGALMAKKQKQKTKKNEKKERKKNFTVLINGVLCYFAGVGGEGPVSGASLRLRVVSEPRLPPALTPRQTCSPSSVVSSNYRQKEIEFRKKAVV